MLYDFEVISKLAIKENRFAQTEFRTGWFARNELDHSLQTLLTRHTKYEIIIAAKGRLATLTR